MKGLRAWLRGSDEGRRLCAELASEAMEKRCRACQEIAACPKVLVVLRRLGLYPGAEVYAEKGCTVRMMEMPDVSEGGLLDEWIESRLPRNWRHMTGLPSRRIDSEVFRGQSLQEVANYMGMAEAIREIQRRELEQNGQ